MEELNRTSKKGTSDLFLNPLIKKLSKINEDCDVCATYAGIIKKSIFFLITIVLGGLLAVILNSFNPITVDAMGELHVSPVCIIAALVSMGIFLITPFLAFIIRRTIPVTGALYCISTGYILSFVALLVPEFTPIILLALVLTITIVFVMAALYLKKKVKVDRKFTVMLRTVLFTSIIGGVLIGIFYLIPATREFVMMMSKNPVLYILCSIGGIIIASLFLMVDFETIRHTVENRLPKRYEWFASFGLIFTIIWLYFKILDLLSHIKN